MRHYPWGMNSATNVPVACGLPSFHPYVHDPAREGYEPFTAELIGEHRILEARSALGAMAMVPAVIPGGGGPVYHHRGNLPAEFGNPGSQSSTSPCTPEGIASAKEVIKYYVDNYPNSFHFTMSQTDDHHDHAACGFALRELKDDDDNLAPGMGGSTYKAALVNARFFVSRLYWENDYANGADVKTMPGLQWFTYYGSNYNAYVSWLKGPVCRAYGMSGGWNPAGGDFGIGYHQVANQFNKNFGPTVTNVANLWHS